MEDRNGEQMRMKFVRLELNLWNGCENLERLSIKSFERKSRTNVSSEGNRNYDLEKQIHRQKNIVSPISKDNGY